MSSTANRRTAAPSPTRILAVGKSARLLRAGDIVAASDVADEEGTTGVERVAEPACGLPGSRLVVVRTASGRIALVDGSRLMLVHRDLF